MAEIFLPKWKPAETNGSQFMKNLDRHLRYEVDLEKYEAKKREIECAQENAEGGQLEENTFAGIKTSEVVGGIKRSPMSSFVTTLT